jgi:hypothetical protein
VWCIHTAAYFTVWCSALLFYFVNKVCPKFDTHSNFKFVCIHKKGWKIGKKHFYPSLWPWAKMPPPAQPASPLPCFPHGLVLAQPTSLPNLTWDLVKEELTRLKSVPESSSSRNAQLKIFPLDSFAKLHEIESYLNREKIRNFTILAKKPYK